MPTADRETAHSREQLAEAAERERRGEERRERDTGRERGDAVDPTVRAESFCDCLPT